MPHLPVTALFFILLFGPEAARAASNCNASSNATGGFEQINCEGQATKDLSKCMGSCNITYTQLGCKIGGESTYIYSAYCPDLPETQDPHESAGGSTKKCNAAPTGGAGWMQGNCAGDISHSGDTAGVPPTCTEGCQTTTFESGCNLSTFQLFTSVQAYSRWCPDLPEVGLEKKVDCSVTASPQTAPVGQAVTLGFFSSMAIFGSGAGLSLKPNGTGSYIVPNLGDNLVTFKAVDAAGNSGECSVTVTGTAAPTKVESDSKDQPVLTTDKEKITTTKKEEITEAVAIEQSSLTGSGDAEHYSSTISLSRSEGDGKHAPGNSFQPGQQGSAEVAAGAPSAGVSGSLQGADSLPGAQAAADSTKPAFPKTIHLKELDSPKNPKTTKSEKQEKAEGRSESSLRQDSANSSADLKDGKPVAAGSGFPVEFPVTTAPGSPASSSAVAIQRHQASIGEDKMTQELNRLGLLLVSGSTKGSSSDESSPQASLFQRVSHRYREISERQSISRIPKGTRQP